MSGPSKVIFLITGTILILLANQAEPVTATAGYGFAAFYWFVSLVAWIKDSRSK